MRSVHADSRGEPTAEEGGGQRRSHAERSVQVARTEVLDAFSLLRDEVVVRPPPSTEVCGGVWSALRPKRRCVEE